MVGAPEPQDFLAPKERLAEWECQDLLERRGCPGSLALRACPECLGRRVPRAKRARQGCLVSAFQGRLEKRESKAWLASREVLARRERKEVLVSQECLVPPGPRACRARPATQGAPGCPERKETRASRAWTASKARKEKQVSLADPAPLALPARRANLAVTDFQGQQGRRASQAFPEEACQASPAPRARKVPKAKWASQDWLGVQESPDPRGSKDSWAPRVPKGSQDSPELQATPWKVPKGTVARRDSLGCQAGRVPWVPLDSLDWTA